MKTSFWLACVAMERRGQTQKQVTQLLWLWHLRALGAQALSPGDESLLKMHSQPCPCGAGDTQDECKTAPLLPSFLHPFQTMYKSGVKGKTRDLACISMARGQTLGLSMKYHPTPLPLCAQHISASNTLPLAPQAGSHPTAAGFHTDTQVFINSLSPPPR